MQIFFVSGYFVFGEDYFRIFPLLFSIASAILLYVVVRRRTDKRTALWSLFLFTICFYNILGSLMPDVDGAILPFFFLLCVYLYDRFCDAVQHKKNQFVWFALLFVALLAGFLVKLSFVLVVMVLALDYSLNYLNNWRKSATEITIKKVTLDALIGIFGLSVFFGAYVGLLYLFQTVYPSFNISTMLGHAGQFTPDVGRNYTQIIVQGIKAIYYLSPLLLVPLIFIPFLSKEKFGEIFSKTRVFFVYLVLGFIFYFIAFDFSRGALDKYLMFLIVPLSVIVGVIFSGIFAEINPSRLSFRLWEFFKNHKWPLLGGLVLSVLLVALNFLPQTVVGLYPKNLWFSRVLHGYWNILTPFTGGSGPAGFYISFLFIAVSFILSLALTVVGLFKKEWKSSLVIVIILLGLSYNALFAEELFFGKINGSVKKVLAETTSFVKGADEIKQVLTFNDIGNHELSKIGKYTGRFYATPDFETGHKKKFADFTGHYVVIEIPRLYDGFYSRFFLNCRIMYETKSGQIKGYVYDCQSAKKLINSL